MLKLRSALRNYRTKSTKLLREIQEEERRLAKEFHIEKEKEISLANARAEQAGREADKARQNASSGSCFMAEAEILLANLGTKAVCEVQVGDKLWSPKGQTATVRWQ